MYSHTKIIPLNHHLWPTRSVLRCLYLQRPCLLPVFSYFAVLGTFLGINLRMVVCSPQVRRWTLLTCNDQWPDRKHVGLPEACALWAREECCVYKPQLTNPTRYAFNNVFKVFFYLTKALFISICLMHLKAVVKSNWKSANQRISIQDLESLWAGFGDWHF